MDENFDHAIKETLENEGGYVNDPDDPGGETKFGISKRSYPDLDIKNLTLDDAIDIYQKDFWEKPGYDQIIPKKVAAKVFDLAVNMGPGRAGKLLQQAINETATEKLKVDGVVGLRTARAVNNDFLPEYLLARLQLLALGYYVRLRKPKYLAGWVKRTLR